MGNALLVTDSYSDDLQQRANGPPCVSETIEGQYYSSPHYSAANSLHSSRGNYYSSEHGSGIKGPPNYEDSMHSPPNQHVRYYTRSEAQRKNYTERYSHQNYRSPTELSPVRGPPQMASTMNRNEPFHDMPNTLHIISFNPPKMVNSNNITSPQTPLFNKLIQRVPVVFRWNEGGRNVFLHGAFIMTKDHCTPMIHDEDGFYTILLLPIKDGNWTYSKNQPKMKNYNMSDYVNYINMNEYVPFSEECKCMEANKQYIMERSFREPPYIRSIQDFHTSPPPLNYLQKYNHLNHDHPDNAADECKFVNLNHLYTNLSSTEKETSYYHLCKCPNSQRSKITGFIRVFGCTFILLTL